MLPYLLPGCPWTPWYRDGEVEVGDRVPRGGKRALGVEIPTENSSISVSTRHVCDHCFSRKCDGVLSKNKQVGLEGMGTSRNKKFRMVSYSQ
jgi:hypothetical protein